MKLLKNVHCSFRSGGSRVAASFSQKLFFTCLVFSLNRQLTIEQYSRLSPQFCAFMGAGIICGEAT